MNDQAPVIARGDAAGGVGESRISMVAGNLSSLVQREGSASGIAARFCGVAIVAGSYRVHPDTLALVASSAKLRPSGARTIFAALIRPTCQGARVCAAPAPTATPNPLRAARRDRERSTLSVVMMSSAGTVHKSARFRRAREGDPPNV